MCSKALNFESFLYLLFLKDPQLIIFGNFWFMASLLKGSLLPFVVFPYTKKVIKPRTTLLNHMFSVMVGLELH